MSQIYRIILYVCILGSVGSVAPSTGIAQTPIAKFTATGLRPNENVGWSVATDGKLVLIGTGAGSAFLFDPFAQQQLTKFTVSDPRFHTSVALEGTTAVVGSRSGANVYDFSNLSSIVTKQLAPNDGPQSLFGVSVDISGDTIIVGANSDDFLGSFTGSAYLFDRSSGAQFAKLTADDAKAGDNFGISVAVDGNRATVGSTGATNSEGDSDGAVYLFNTERNVVGERQLARYEITPDNPNFVPNFGYNVDIARDNILALETQGRSFVWQSQFQPAVGLGPSTIRSAGDALSIHANIAAVGFPGSNVVKLYDLLGMPTGSAAAPESTAASFGFSVAVGGNLVVIGAPGSSNGGAAYVYHLQDLIVPEPSSAGLLSVLCVLIIRRRWFQN